MVPVALTIAGSDPSGGAGLQADLKTFHQHRVYGTAVASVLTVQDTTGVHRVEVVEPGLVADQLDAVLADIPPAACKTGALGDAALVRLVAERFVGGAIPLVVDPVRIATRGSQLLADDARAVLLEELLPAARLVTPNADEAAWLTGMEVRDERGARAAAAVLLETGVGAVLLKGGHLGGSRAIDLLCTRDGLFERLGAARIGTRHTHGLGCALSAAITAWLACGAPLPESCRLAKRWLTHAIATAPGLGAGAGPINHLAPIPDRSARGPGAAAVGASGAER